jgi:asparagine synthase (glutamine-hydrolysing)
LRFPFLDREVIQLAAFVGAPARPCNATVHPLRRLLSRRLPQTLMPPVITQQTPYPWLAGALAAMVPGILLGRRFDGRDIFYRPALQQLWDEHTAGYCDHSHRLWSLLMLELWFREFIDGDAVEQEPIEYAFLRAA